MNTTRKFGIDNPDQYWQDRNAQGRNQEKRIHRFIKHLVDREFPDGGKVLICGVGDGHEFRLCSEKHEAYGVEYSAEAIAGYSFSTDNIKLADLNNGIPNFGVKFDAVVISMVLHWLDDPEGFLRDARAHLTNVGTIFPFIPNITNYHYRLGFLFGRFPPISASHKNFQTPLEAEAMFERAGYNTISRQASKNSIKTRLWPTLFGTDIGYVLKP